MCYTEKTPVVTNFTQARAVVSCGTVGHEFNVNESAVDIKQGIIKQKYT